MKRRIVVFLTLVFIFYYSAQLFGQPTPYDNPFGTGNDQKPVGGGADLGQQVTILVVFAIAYACFKYRERILRWYLSLDI